MNYGGLDCTYTQYERSKFVIIPVPYDLTSTYQPGSRRGPEAIISASANMELYDEELDQETYEAGIHTTDPIEVDARGPAEMIDKVRQKLLDVLRDGKVPITIGGEHSISFGVVQAFKTIYPQLTVLQLDAHADLRKLYQGTPFSHAAVARRISEICPLVQVGIRSMSREESEFLSQGLVKNYSINYLRKIDNWSESICKDLGRDIYVTIDVDVLDPSFMPSTGTPEPGGMSWDEVISLIREVSLHSKIHGFDVVELAPIPGMIAPDFLVAKLIYRVMGYILSAEMLNIP